MFYHNICEQRVNIKPHQTQNYYLCTVSITINHGIIMLIKARNKFNRSRKIMIFVRMIL